jgi:transposase
MSIQNTIRDMYRSGESKSAIAKALAIDRKTVRKYLKEADFSPPMPISAAVPSILDPFKVTIDEWLEADRNVFHKQRHTAKRICERLQAELGYIGGYGPVQRYVKLKKQQMHAVRPVDEPLDLIWSPGSMQADFGQADFVIDGVTERKHYLTSSYPHSNGGFTQLFGGESAECVCQGLKDTFSYVGSVPQLIVFDNATGVGKRIKETVTETELFSRFRAHYGFKVNFCNRESGHEKGSVERKVAFHRKNLFVPVPSIRSMEEYNKELFDRCLELEAREHYRKKKSIHGLLQEDLKASLALPERPFDCVRYEHHKADGYGYVTLDSHHVYSTSPAFSRREVIVAIRAHMVEVYDSDGCIIATHPRQFGKGRTESIDAASTVRYLAKKPGAWKNSLLRATMPDAVVAKMDTLDKDALRANLKLLAQSIERSGMENTFDALDVLARDHEDFPDFFQVGVLAARIADLGLEAPPVPGGGLDVYDELFLNAEVGR